MAKKDRKQQRQENKELKKISREMGSAMDVGKDDAQADKDPSLKKVGRQEKRANSRSKRTNAVNTLANKISEGTNELNPSEQPAIPNIMGSESLRSENKIKETPPKEEPSIAEDDYDFRQSEMFGLDDTYSEVPSSGDAESIKIIEEAINGEPTTQAIDINEPLNNEGENLADQENAFQRVFRKGKDVINEGVSAVGELFGG